jgi:hypothetical protein
LVSPPKEDTTIEKAKEILMKFCSRSAYGFIVYAIQDEKGRVEDIERPFPFRKQ